MCLWGHFLPTLHSSPGIGTYVAENAIACINNAHLADMLSDADNLDEMIPVITAGYLLMGAGLTALSAGIPLSIIGNKRLDWIASDYNQRSGYQATLSWGFNRYGVGLALKF